MYRVIVSFCDEDNIDCISWQEQTTQRWMRQVCSLDSIRKETVVYARDARCHDTGSAKGIEPRGRSGGEMQIGRTFANGLLLFFTCVPLVTRL